MIRSLYTRMAPAKAVPMKPICKAVLIGAAVVAASTVLYMAYVSYCDCDKKKKRQVGEGFVPGVPKETGPPSGYLAPNLEPAANTKQGSTYATAPSVTLAPPQ